MKLNTAAIVIHSDKNPQKYSLFKNGGGAPATMAPVFVLAFGGQRARRHPGRFIIAIAAAQGFGKSSAYTVYNSDYALLESPDWIYEISLKRFSIDLKVTQIDRSDKTIHYEGALELFLTKAVRGRIKPRGRTPKGYESRAEYEMALAQRQTRHVAPPESIRDQILRDRAADPNIYPKPNLDGIRILTPAERAARRKNRRYD